MPRVRHFRGSRPSTYCTQITYCVLKRNDGRQSEVIAMGWKYLDAQVRKETVDESIRGVIRGMAEGDAAHQADALKFGLYAALRARQGWGTKYPFALLRCPDAGCASLRPVSYLDPLRRNNFCSSRHEDWRRKAMECSQCGRARKDQCTWCKGCRRLFG